MSKISDSFKIDLLKGLEKSEFNKLGLSRNPFLPFIPKKIIETFVDREEETKLLVRYLPEIINGFLPLLILSGSKSIGKTHFLLYVYSQLNEISDKIGHKIRLLNVDNFKNFYDECKAETKIRYIALIDDSEKIWDNYKTEFVEMVDSKSNIKFISVWNTARWSQIKKDSFYASLKPACIKIGRIDKKNLIDMVNIRIKPFCIEGSPFDKKSLELLAEISEGIPFSMIYYSEKLLHYALDKAFNKIDENLTKSFINEIHIRNFDVTTLKNKQLQVLKTLLNLTTSEKRGVTSTEISNTMGVSRSTVIPHLKFLSRNKKILEEKMENKKNLYYIKPMFLEHLELYFGSNEI